MPIFFTRSIDLHHIQLQSVERQLRLINIIYIILLWY